MLNSLSSYVGLYHNTDPLYILEPLKGITSSQSGLECEVILKRITLNKICKAYVRKMGEFACFGEKERLSLSAFLGTEDMGVHIVHISRVIITYTLE